MKKFTVMGVALMVLLTGCSKSAQEEAGIELVEAIKSQNCSALEQLCSIDYNDFYTQSNFFTNLTEAYGSTLIGSELTVKDYEYDKSTGLYTMQLSDGQEFSLVYSDGKFILPCIEKTSHCFIVPQNSIVKVNGVTLGEKYVVTSVNGYSYYKLNDIAKETLEIVVSSEITGEYTLTVEPDEFVTSLDFNPEEEEHFEEVPLNPDKVESICEDLNEEIQEIFDTLQLDDCTALDLTQLNMPYSESQFNEWIDLIKENRQMDSEYTKYFDAIVEVTLGEESSPIIVAENTVSLDLEVFVSWAVGDGSMLCKMTKIIPVTVQLVDGKWSLYEVDFLDLFILSSVTE